MRLNARQRLMKDLHNFHKEKSNTIFTSPLEDDILTWVAIIYGPINTYYENGTFCLILEFTDNYPYNPPTIRFICNMFHPNIYTDGRLCLDILSNKWTPTYDVFSILMSIQSLLNDPNPDSPANIEAAEVFLKSKVIFEKKVKETVILSWKDFEDFENFV
ncbi:Ubiquitin-conjugating enzyme E2 1 [Cucumispora dikerogammari]|nr:Ubiquitin-conjugating enzyme E2 1 [Cucumispora dikerogammari]